MGLLRSAQLIGHNFIQSVKAQSNIKGLGARFLKGIYLYYFLTLLWSEPILNLVHDTAQPSENLSVLVMFVKFVCKCQNEKAAPFYNHCNNNVLSGFNNTRQGDLIVRVKAITISFNSKSSQSTIKHNDPHANIYFV